MIDTKEDWIRTFMERSNDLAIANSFVSNATLVDTLTALTNAVHNDPPLAGLMVRSIQKKVMKMHRYDPSRSTPLQIVKELSETSYLVGGTEFD